MIVTRALSECVRVSSLRAFADSRSVIVFAWPAPSWKEPLASVRIAFFAACARAETAVSVFSVTVPVQPAALARTAHLERERAVCRDRDRRSSRSSRSGGP